MVIFISEIEENIGENDNTLKALVKEGLLFGLIYSIPAAIITLIFFLIFGFDWFFANYYFYGLYILYPLVLVVFFFCVIRLKKRSVKEFLLLKPKLPEKGHRWIYSIIILFMIVSIVIHIILFWLDMWYFLPIKNINWFYIIPPVIFAPLIEEIIYRGYINHRLEEIYGDSGIEIAFFSQDRDENIGFSNDKLLKWKITTADIGTSLFFTFSHVYIYYYFFNISDPYDSLNYLISFYFSIFILGLLLSQARRDWNSLIPCMILHALCNLHLSRFIVYNSDELRKLSFIIWILMDSSIFYPIGTIFIGSLVIAILFRLAKKYRLVRKTKSIQAPQKE